MVDLNLQYLVPEQYLKSDVIQALLDALNSFMGEWADDISGLHDIINSELVPNDYMQYLADL